MNLLTSVFGIILIVKLCAANPSRFDPEERIFGGYEIDIEEVPWQVSVNKNDSQNCGGSIISDRWVLTASHCGEPISIDEMSVGVGHSDAAKGKKIPIKRYVRHPNRTFLEKDYDFLLLELPEPLEFSKNVQPIALPDADTNVAEGTECLLSGWGKTEYSSGTAPHLRAVTLPIASSEFCKNQYEYFVEITPRMICAGYKEGGKDACNGDSGGPLVCEINGVRQLIGVVSFSYKVRGNCAVPGYPGVNRRVTAVRDWIKSEIGI